MIKKSISNITTTKQISRHLVIDRCHSHSVISVSDHAILFYIKKVYPLQIFNFKYYIILVQYFVFTKILKCYFCCKLKYRITFCVSKSIFLKKGEYLSLTTFNLYN